MSTNTSEARVDLSTRDGVTELETHVRLRLGGRLRDFRLVVGAEGITLRGRVRTYYAKQLAQHTVMYSANLPIRANEIVVS